MKWSLFTFNCVLRNGKNLKWIPLYVSHSQVKKNKTGRLHDFSTVTPETLNHLCQRKTTHCKDGSASKFLKLLWSSIFKNENWSTLPDKGITVALSMDEAKSFGGQVVERPARKATSHWPPLQTRHYHYLTSAIQVSLSFSKRTTFGHRHGSTFDV